MSGTSVPGLKEVGERDPRRDDDGKNSGLIPERHDSKVDNNEPNQSAPQDVAIQDVRSKNANAIVQNATALHLLDTSTHVTHPPLAHRSSKPSTPASAGLQIKTNVYTPSQNAGPRLQETPTIFETPVSADMASTHHTTSPIHIPVVGSSLRSNLSTSSMASSSISPGSALASPYLASMSDLTPLPSPMVLSESGSAVWRRALARPGSPSRSRAGSLEDPTPLSRRSLDHISPTSPQKRKKAYGSLFNDTVDASRANATAVVENTKASKGGHTRNRSVSDFVPEQLHNTRHRHVTFGPGDAAGIEAQEYRMQRERYLAAQRGLTVPLDAKSQRQLPSPPPSSSSVGESDEADEERLDLEDGAAADYLEIHCGLKNKRRKFRQLRQLGQGTFSKVVLATWERLPAHPTPEIEDHLNPHKLVAVKIVEHGPAGGALEQRIETGLKREVEMLKSISHPSLVHLKACEYQPTRALLVLTYCPGGDLFELASQKRNLLSPPMVQRIFSELVHAVRYLHMNWIVHRDIKLENVLVNLPTHTLESIQDPLTYRAPIVTLTDLGLSRKIPEPPESPLLQTRCGSEDYAAPEILLGQPYDGRQTDAWALGVFLYALMEGRLPFDAPPGKPDRSRNTHRIARCDWIWCRFGDEEGDWDPSRGAEFEGAQFCVEGLLKKVRMGRKPLEAVEQSEWVQNGIQVPGGLQMRDDGEDDAFF
ncbi:hypothetical protein LTR37_017569 [Vermiconidia calcicola]|uniref:Uncharacterized protein n=1 Tax=Vermiconidia calcicola TaxID=1690605 RepID=A0ACC3MJZ2_9PEZI|nr:hypothetical protein LTR37_017569 [Vermiconidia calcicola]